ncbi:hypothetical protein [Flavobacterium psychrotrophum]|uniref:hypothetical protein n=1 Tax=Flavobacterium psychrotrophum TaxID=2294119 RepID=UPI000E315CF7|nr:hypothetical protein [Flavobacterium psychrotrophum]
MQNKIGLIIIIVFFLTLLISIKRSRKGLWAKDTSQNSRMFTLRAVLFIAVILLYLFFSLVR